MRLVNTGEGQPSRRKSAAKDGQRTETASGGSSSASSRDSQNDVVLQVSRENLAAAVTNVPTPEEARDALNRLRQDLPELGQGVGDLHSNLNRSRILSLLAPLVES